MAFFVQDTRALWELYPFSPIHTPYFLSCAHTCTHRLPFTFLRWVIMRTWSNPFSITDRLHAFIFPIQSENVLLQIFSSTTSDRTMGVVLYNNAIVVHLPHPHLAASGCQPLWRSHQRSSSSHAFTDGWSGPMECLVAEWRAHLVAAVLSLLPRCSLLRNSKQWGFPAYLVINSSSSQVELGLLVSLTLNILISFFTLALLFPQLYLQLCQQNSIRIYFPCLLHHRFYSPLFLVLAYYVLVHFSCQWRVPLFSTKASHYLLLSVYCLIFFLLLVTWVS